MLETTPVQKTKNNRRDDFMNVYEKVKNEFPILEETIFGKRIVYLDSAATGLTPNRVVNAVNHYYKKENSNVHRGLYHYSEVSTQKFERARDIAKNYINANKQEEIIYTSGTTNAVNLVASSYGDKFIKEGDDIILSTMEHHSNIVPWQMMAQKKNANIKVIPINDRGELDVEAFKDLLSEKTKIVSITHVSNTLGTINPVKEITRLAHEYGAKVFVDGAQAIPHLAVDVQDIDCDFYAFSGHKFYGPTGTGILYGKEAILESMPPYFGGGDMIDQVSFKNTTYAGLPNKFEAGTPNIAGFIGLAHAFELINELNIKEIENYEHELLLYTQKMFEKIPEIKIIGNANHKVPVFSFYIEGIHSQDIGTFCNREALAMRTGHHCTQPLMERFGIDSTTRASLSFYNSKEDIDRLEISLKKVIEFFGE